MTAARRPVARAQVKVVNRFVFADEGTARGSGRSPGEDGPRDVTRPPQGTRRDGEGTEGATRDGSWTFGDDD